jgi:carbamoyl-phosphate synthase small subunit
MKARLILEDGQVFEGTRFGAPNDVITEIIFTTGSTGYVELLTDPSAQARESSWLRLL